jgi:hypothetical protein
MNDVAALQRRFKPERTDMFAIQEGTQLPDYTKLDLVPEGSDVVVLLTSAKDQKGTKGHFAIFEGKVAEVTKGPLVKGEAVKVFMVQLDDSRRQIRQKDGSVVNYAINDVVAFLEKVNCEPLPKKDTAALNTAIEAMCTNIAGMGIRITAAKNPGDADTKPFTERKFHSIPNQDLTANRALLKTL